ncbi:MAG TPA: hypothetical protein VGH10_03685 [Actinomycetota bacterium]|jgi:hypothetical protein
MRGRRVLSAALVALLAMVVVAVTARASHASWSGSNCSEDNHTEDSLKREDARAYGDVADNEGYEWDGGCWNDNNKDDTPGAPDSGGEGPDCSGLVFKTWELRWTKGVEGFRWYNRMENRHGPYYTWDYHSPIKDDPFFLLANKHRDTTLYMDAFAKDGHVGLLNTDAYPSVGNDYILEAYGDESGTDINIEDYRSDDAYDAVRRGAWTPDCSPKCLGAPPVAIVP